MPSWIIDDPTVLYAVLGLAAIVFGALWWNARKRWTGIAFLQCLTAIVIVAVLSHAIDSDAKRIERKIHEMVAGVENRDVGRIFQHISTSFHAGNMDKAAFRAYADRYLESRHPQGINVWDFEARELSRAERWAMVTFKIKGQGIEESEVNYYNVCSAFVLDPDDQWRMRDFQLFSPTVDPMKGEALALPGFAR